MKARVKATGDIIEISEDCSYLYAENYDKSYNLNELEFLDVKKKSLTAIGERHSNIKFDNYIYYGRLNGYDVFDTSEVCEENLEKIYEANETIYYIECSTLDNIKLYKKGEVISLKKAFENGIVTIDDILSSNLPVVMAAREIENNS